MKIEFDRKVGLRIGKLTRRIGASNIEVVRRALADYEFLHVEKGKGYSLVLRADGEPDRELDLR